MQQALSRTAIILAGFLLVSLVGVPMLHARYDAGLAPIPFIAWIYLPFALFGVALHALVPWEKLWIAFAAIAVAAAAVVLALSETFRLVFWLVVVPASGLIAAAMPGPVDRQLSERVD